MNAGAQKVFRAQGYIPVKEAAAKLGYTTQTFYNWIDSGKIAGIRVGAARWVMWASVTAYFKRCDPQAAKLLGLP